jgi:hypothetical protein
MEDLVIEKKINFRSSDFSSSSNIETLRFNLTPTDIVNLKTAIELVKTNRFIASINVSLDGVVDYLDDEGNDEDDWRIDVDHFIVYNSSIYYYAQNKYDSSDQIESEEITSIELGIELEVETPE